MDILQFIFQSFWHFCGFAVLLLFVLGTVVFIAAFITDSTSGKKSLRQRKQATAEPTVQEEPSHLSGILVGSEGVTTNSEAIAAALKTLSTATGFAMVTVNRIEDGSFSVEANFSDPLEAKTLYELGLAQVVQSLFSPMGGEGEQEDM